MRAAAELRAILPDRVVRHIDWYSLQAVHASFVDTALSQRHGDLMFSARLKEGHEAYLWLLFVHQSTVDRWMPFRVLEMAVEFLKGWRKEHPRAQRLPAILPIVLYQGATPWTAPRTLAELYDLSDQALHDLGEFLLSLREVDVMADADCQRFTTWANSCCRCGSCSTICASRPTMRSCSGPWTIWSASRSWS